MKKIIITIAAVFVFSAAAFGQSKEISMMEYYKPYREALRLFEAVESRRATSKDEFFVNGELDHTIETITENVKPDRFRFVVIETADGKRKKSDLIKIGTDAYCRLDEGDWTNTAGGCNQGWTEGVSADSQRQYFVETVTENGKPVEFYRLYVTYRQNNPMTKQEDSFYQEYKFWIGKDGKFVREEIEKGLQAPKQTLSKRIRYYDYDAKDVKIDAPVK